MPSKERFTTPKVVLLDVYDTMLRMDEVERKVNGLLNNKLSYTGGGADYKNAYYSAWKVNLGFI